MAVVRNRTEAKSDGIFATLPATISIAIASPTARPVPWITEAITPLFAALSETRNQVSAFVAPSAREASSYSRGTARSAVSETDTMYGRIITVSTRMAVSRHAPEERENVFCTNGTSTVMPTRPYTTEGMPASSATQLRAAAAMRGGAALARNTAVKRPSGTPRSSAPAVP